jgi:hypothetical protein
MWGPGILVHVISILPFAGPFLWTMLYSKRYNWISNNPYGNRRNYNRRLWVRLFFGRFNYLVIPIGAFIYFSDKYLYKKNSAVFIAEMNTQLEEVHKFDEEASPENHRALVHDLKTKKMTRLRDQILKHRAERDHQLKTEAFKEFTELYEKI